MTRNEVTELIITQKLLKQMTWSQLADAIGLSKEWTTAALLGELIHEEFGDGIMSAIDFNMDLQRETDPKGDRVNITMSGKFLPYKTY